ncbi:ABC transporter ATP-binding protein [Cellulomonas sp. WB94]|uniref:ABC transporter ATP-binding protein n=1 Tax=Cellulomonas sp. WB94 TaxID=2173174 RepID=UPI000D568124|nr:ABC transporter ATP-binding protein [Cellulomonas sp. WB94]PVU83467.1 ABC transporter ATP-binding protein [Cellulomonas sp. WB94]
MTAPAVARGGLHADVVVGRGDFRLEAAFRVAPGEVLAVLGPNGAGKTTLLRSLAGLGALTDGRLVVGADTWDDARAGVFVPAVDRAVGLVFQDYRLFPHLSVLDNVAFSARARGARRTDARRDAADWLARMDLADLARSRPGALSGGQAQRVALARALACDPQLLLLDEPLAALDARTRLEVRGELRRHLAAFGGPSILVTHDPLEAMVLADRLLVLESGRIVQEGTPAEVARRPATDYVARLVGLNLYAGTMTDRGTRRVDLDTGGVLFAAGHGQDADDEDAATPAAAGTGMLVVLAPTAISIHTSRPDSGSARNTWTGVVAGLELLTDRVRVAVDGTPSALVDITPAAVADLRLAPGQPVWLTAKATEVIAYADPGPTPARAPAYAPATDGPTR